ncbi:MAG: hypothetical protein K0U21_06250 [Proteobacteria bacterium]|nr:hypothetical protein [Pseudomonadota bacterium]
MLWFLGFIGFLLVLWLAEKIPGLHLLVSPIITALTSIAHFLAVSLFEYSVWFVKTVFRSHFVFIKHLFRRRVDLNPVEAAMKKNKSV